MAATACGVIFSSVSRGCMSWPSRKSRPSRASGFGSRSSRRRGSRAAGRAGCLRAATAAAWCRLIDSLLRCLGLTRWDFQLLQTPEPMHTLDVHVPPVGDQQRMHPPVAVTRVRVGQLLHLLDQAMLEITGHRDVTLRRAVLPEHLAGPTLGDLVTPDQEGHRVPPPGRAHQFPLCRSLNIEMSKACSATMRSSREFSASNAFSRCASSSLSAPYFCRHR